MCIFATQGLVIERSRISVYKKSITQLDQEQRPSCISYIDFVLFIWLILGLHHMVMNHMFPCYRYFSIFIENQCWGLGLTQVVTMPDKTFFVCCLLSLSNWKKINMSAQTTSGLFIHASRLYYLYLYSRDGAPLSNITLSNNININITTIVS